MKLKEFIHQNKTAIQEDKMSSKADANFEQLLKDKLHQPKKQKVVFLKFIAVAASLGLLIATFVWFNNQPEINKKQQQLLSNLENESVGKRLEGVYTFNDEYAKEDDKIIETLLSILHKDENTNVKIATIDALLKFPKNESIRKSFIKALEKEDVPLVQIKLIKAVSFLRENRAQKSLEKIINSEQTFPIVKNNATLAMAEIKK